MPHMHVRVCLPRHFKFIFSCNILQHKIEFCFFFIEKIILVFPIFSHATALIAEYTSMLARPAAHPPTPTPPHPMHVLCKHCCNADSSYISLNIFKLSLGRKIVWILFLKNVLKCLKSAAHACSAMFTETI